MHLTPNILRRLIKKPEVIVDLKHTDLKPVVLYERDRPTDFFCFILEGEHREGNGHSCGQGHRHGNGTVADKETDTDRNTGVKPVVFHKTH